MPDNKHLHIDPVEPDPGMIRRAVDTMRSGGVVVYPTSMLYGLGADAANRKAVDRVFSLKQRMDTKPVSILIGQVEDLERLVTNVPEAAQNIMDRVWPGKVTLVFFASTFLPENLTAGTGKIGIRLPLHPVAKMLLKEAGFPVTATSANLSGEPGCGRIEAMAESILREADLVLDAGVLAGGIGSTVVDVTVFPPKTLREGAISAEDIHAAASGFPT